MPSEDNVHFVSKDDYTQSIGFNCTYYRYDGYEKQLKEFGSDNLYQSLLDDNVFFIDNNNDTNVKYMEKYLMKYYSNHKIEGVKVKDCDNFSVYKFLEK